MSTWEVWAIQRNQAGEEVWTRVGDARQNRDGTMALRLHMVPLGAVKFTMRPVPPGFRDQPR